MLAPMEGVVNARMRRLLTNIGGIDRCVTEFVRVNHQVLPDRVFHRLCPELKEQGTTESGVPVFVQLLGSDAPMMANNAERAEILGAKGLDINFGCPAKTVNRHRGGSVLLTEPNTVYDVVSAMRNRVSKNIPVHAKIRLGYENDSLLSEIVDAVQSGGANELVIHARTKADGYKPPAHWHRVKPLLHRYTIPIVINGEIWTIDDAIQAQLDSGCADIMLGRGLLARPDLPLTIQNTSNGIKGETLAWQDIHQLLLMFFRECIVDCPPKHVGGPVKQWLGYLRNSYPEAEVLLSQIKRLKTIEDLERGLSANSCPKQAA